MLQITRSNTPAPMGIGRLNNTWKKFAFFFHKRAFESKIEGLLTAAAGHESNSLPVGNYQYQILNARADELCTEFANRFDLDLNLLRARIPGLAKLAGLSVPPPAKNYTRLACFSMFAIPLALFLIGVMAGLVSVGFHLVGGR
jgi:hypothetical protein